MNMFDEYDRVPARSASEWCFCSSMLKQIPMNLNLDPTPNALLHPGRVSFFAELPRSPGKQFQRNREKDGRERNQNTERKR